MAGYATHILLLTLLLLQLPLLYLGYKPPAFLLIFGIASLAQPFLFVYGQQVLYGDWLRRLVFMPSLLFIAIGLAPSNSRAIIEAIGGAPNDFVRTPKGPRSSSAALDSRTIQSAYHLPFDWIIFVELALALYSLLGIVVSLQRSTYWPLIFMTA